MKKEFMDNILNEKFLKKLFVNECEPVYTLEECLNRVNKDFFDIAYNACNERNGIKNKKKQNKNQKISYLAQETIPFFIEHLNDCKEEVIEILKNVSVDKPESEFNLEMCSRGFMYGFKKNDEIVFVVPKEIIEAFNENYTKELEENRQIEFVFKCLHQYLFVNGLIPIDEFKDIVYNFYNLDIDEKNFEEGVRRVNQKVIKDKYYSLNLDETDSTMLEKLIKKKDTLPYKRFIIEELDDYMMFMDTLASRISNALNIKENSVLVNLIVTFSLLDLNIDHACTILQGRYNLSDDEMDELREILEENISEFKIWGFNGMTHDEYLRKLIFSEFVIKEKHKNDDLMSWLKVLPEAALGGIKKYYEKDDISVKELSKVIIDALKEDIDCYDNFEIEEILESNELGEIDNISNEEFVAGHVFLYEEDDMVLPFIPKEILEIFEENYDPEASEKEYIESLFLKYVYLNGIIEVDTLIKLLKDNHDISLTKSDLDSISSNNITEIIEDKYYTLIIDADKEDIKELMPLKAKFGKYKEADVFDSSEEIENDFKVELEQIYVDKYGKNDDKIDELFYGVVLAIKYASCNKYVLNDIFEGISFKVSDDFRKKVEALIKKYKNDICTWVYNGYTVNEHNELMSSKKVGRNDPCPCGSGKKYKKCCGK